MRVSLIFKDMLKLNTRYQLIAHLPAIDARMGMAHSIKFLAILKNSDEKF